MRFLMIFSYPNQKKKQALSGLDLPEFNFLEPPNNLPFAAGLSSFLAVNFWKLWGVI